MPPPAPKPKKDEKPQPKLPLHQQVPWTPGFHDY